MFHIQATSNESIRWWHETKGFVSSPDDATTFKEWRDCDKTCDLLNAAHNNKVFFQRKKHLPPGVY
jgi:hypothetical protein